MSRLLFLGLTLPLLTAAACSRSTLDDLPAIGATSAGGGSTVSSAVSTGAGGGPPGPCNALEQQAIRSFDDELDHKAHAARLLASSADGQQASLLLRMDQEPTPIDGNSELAHITFMPWGSWPATSLGSVVRLAAASGFVTPRRADDGISYWAAYATFASGPGMHYQLGLSTETPPYPGSLPALAQAHRPAFITVGDAAGRHAIGWIDNTPGVQLAHVAIATAAGISSQIIACTTSGMRLSGIQLDSGGYLAALTVSQADACGALAMLEVRRVDGGETTITHSQPTNALMQLQLVPRNEGAWLLWQTDDGDTTGPLLALPLNAFGVPTGEPVTLFHDGVIFQRVAATEFGHGGLAIAYADTFDPGPPTIIVQLFDPSAAELAATSFAPIAWPNINEGFSLLSSPAADAVLLSWSSSMDDDNIAGNTRGFVTRFDCLP